MTSTGNWGRIQWSLHEPPKGASSKETLRARLGNKEVHLYLKEPWALMSEEDRYKVRQSCRRSLGL